VHKLPKLLLGPVYYLLMCRGQALERMALLPEGLKLSPFTNRAQCHLPPAIGMRKLLYNQ